MLYPGEERETRFYFGRKVDNDVRQLRRLAQKLAAIKIMPNDNKGSRYTLNYHSYYKPSSSGGMQFVTFKMNYSNKLESHKKFLKYYMTQENKDAIIEKPVLFGKDNTSTVESYEDRMTDRHFKFILSPESPNVPLKEFTRTFMEKISKELKIDFDYLASIHTDTAHPHVHIVINGNDLQGKTLNKPFPPGFIQRRAHEISSQIATAMIGERTAEQRRESYQRSFTSTRFTQHDQKIKDLVGSGLTLKNVSDETQKRLAHLVKIKVATFSNGVFTLEKNWDNTLKTVGRYNSFLKAREELKFTMPTDLELFQTGKITGTVRKIYSLNDEFENDNAIVIEDEKTKRAYFVPLFKPISTKNEGKNCTVKMEMNSKGRITPKIEYEKESENTKGKGVTYS